MWIVSPVQMMLLYKAPIRPEAITHGSRHFRYVGTRVSMAMKDIGT